MIRLSRSARVRAPVALSPLMMVGQLVACEGQVDQVGVNVGLTVSRVWLLHGWTMPAEDSSAYGEHGGAMVELLNAVRPPGTSSSSRSASRAGSGRRGHRPVAQGGL
jgi:hypothetical protein